jgi:hypothetical protein
MQEMWWQKACCSVEEVSTFISCSQTQRRLTEKPFLLHLRLLVLLSKLQLLLLDELHDLDGVSITVKITTATPQRQGKCCFILGSVLDF